MVNPVNECLICISSFLSATVFPAGIATFIKTQQMFEIRSGMMNRTNTDEDLPTTDGVQRINGTDILGNYWDLPTTVILSTLFSLVIILTIIGNFMVIRIVIKHKNMRSKTNMFFVNLAAADFLVGSLLAPTSLATLINGNWVFGKGTFGTVVCKMNGFANTMCLIVSIHTLMYISIYKYFGITNPLSTKFTKTKVALMIAASWIWAVVCSVLTVTGLTTVEYKPGTTQCGASYPDGQLGALLHHLLIQITDILIPIAIIIYTQSKMLWAVKQYSARLKEHSNVSECRVLAQRKRVTITVFIVVVTFVICWIPYHVYAMHVSLVKDKTTISNIANPVAYLFSYFNSACNPIIYGLRSKSFREGYKEFLPANICPSKNQQQKGHLTNRRNTGDFTAKFSSIEYIDNGCSKGATPVKV